MLSSNQKIAYLSGILGLFFGGFALYLSLNSYPIGGFGVETDFYWDYAPAADAFLNGHLPMEHLAFRGPGYPLVLAAFGWLGDTFLAGKIVSALSSGIVVALLGWMLFRRFGIPSGIVGIAVLAMNGVFLEYSVRVGTDMFFLMLNVTATALLGWGKSSKLAFWAGIFAGWGFLTRYNGLALILAIGVWIIVVYVRRDDDYKARVRNGLIGVLLPVLPWLIILALNSSDTTSGSNFGNVLYELESSGHSGWEDHWYGAESYSDETTSQMTINNRGRILAGASKNIIDNFIDDQNNLTGTALALLALIGIAVLTFGRGSAGEWKWGLIIGIFNYIILLFVFYSPRFSLCLIPAYIALALITVEWMSLSFDRRSTLLKNAAAAAGLVMLLLIPPPQSWKETIRKIEKAPKYYLDFANRDELKSLPEGRIAARKPHLPYLLGMPFKVIPILNNPYELLDWMKINGVIYLFISSHEMIARPALAGLLGSQIYFQNLESITFKADNPKAGFWKLKKSNNEQDK